jgi:hypothetical protein
MNCLQKETIKLIKKKKNVFFGFIHFDVETGDTGDC